MLAEAMALEWACREVDAVHVIAAVDSDTVGVVVVCAFFSDAGGSAEHLRKQTASAGHSRKMNAADAPSRDRPLDQGCVNTTWLLLQRELLAESTASAEVS